LGHGYILGLSRRHTVAKVTGWATILLLHAIMIFMMVMGLEVMDDLRSNQLKLSITIMVAVTWMIGGVITYAIHESMKEPL
jgi:hypothetical protein